VLIHILFQSGYWGFLHCLFIYIFGGLLASEFLFSTGKLGVHYLLCFDPGSGYITIERPFRICAIGHSLKECFPEECFL
jgi:hypothetical protein